MSLPSVETARATMLSAIVAIFIQWYRDSQREAKRIDRALDREEALAAKARYDADVDADPGDQPQTDEDMA